MQETYGQQIPRSDFSPRSVIAPPEVAPVGNVILRVGREHGPGVRGWQQTEHVVLSPQEALRFALVIIDRANLTRAAFQSLEAQEAAHGR